MSRSVAVVTAVLAAVLVAGVVWWRGETTRATESIARDGSSSTAVRDDVSSEVTTEARPRIGAPTYAGPRDPRGRFADNTGALVGRRDSTGGYYGTRGDYVGRADSTNNYYAPSGRYVGRLNDDGSFFDATGAYAGRVDSQGNVYDNTGASTRHNGSCDDACRQDTVARILLGM
jgi:hypothetical protein